jgi:DNA repair protein RadD
MTLKPLFLYQAQAIAELRAAYLAGKKRPVLQAPTGSGKTRIAAEIINHALERGKRVTFTVPALSLIDQTIEHFWAEGIRDIGVMQADHKMTAGRRPVQVASVQTLARRKFPETDLVIVDECHRNFDCIQRWMRERVDLLFCGLSATPWTKGLGKHYDHLVVVTRTQDLIDEGRLSPFRVFAPGHPDLSGVRIVAGDYKEDDLSKAVNTTQLVGDIVKTWAEKAEGRQTLVFAVDRAHAKHLQERFLAAGVTATYQDMNTTDAERAAIRRGFHDGTYCVVCNVGTLTTGVDWDVRCVVLARPTKSEILFVQIVGRGLRTALGKSDCLILDHSDNHSRLGFVTSIHHAELDDGKGKKPKEKKKPSPRECPQCHFLRPPRVMQCPNCGQDAIKVRRPKIAGMGQPEANGKLRQFNGHGPLVRVGGQLMDRADLYRELAIYAEQKGYSHKFAAASFKEITGQWPERHRRSLVTQVSPAVARIIAARQIGYFNRRRRT